MAEPHEQTGNNSEQIEVAGVSGAIDLETLRKLKELCARYGKETVKELVNDAAKAA